MRSHEPTATTVKQRLIDAVPLYYLEKFVKSIYDPGHEARAIKIAARHQWDEEMHVNLLRYFTKGIEHRVQIIDNPLTTEK